MNAKLILFDIDDTFTKYPSIDSVMIGRGLISNPELALSYKKGQKTSALDLKKFKPFHDDLLAQYIELLSGEKPVLHRMKEFLVFWEKNFTDDAKTIKKIRKSNSLKEYTSLTEALLS